MSPLPIVEIDGRMSQVMEHELLTIFRALDPPARELLLERARRLARASLRQTAMPDAGDGESVAQAIRRLVRAYPELERHRLMDAASRVLETHIVGGRPAVDCICELEQLFQREALRRQAD